MGQEVPLSRQLRSISKWLRLDVFYSPWGSQRGQQVLCLELVPLLRAGVVEEGTEALEGRSSGLK